MAITYSLIFCFSFFCVSALIKWTTALRRTRLPAGVRRLPGPRGLPFIGSVHELPEQCSWLKFADWAREYGPIYQVNLGGVNHIWISTDHIARDLLAKRAAIYSDRPHIPALIDDNRTSAHYLPLLSKNDAWTRQRKFAKQIMSLSEKAGFYQYPELESKRMLYEMMKDPSRYNVSLESYIARVTSRLAWGTPSSSDELKQRARELLIGVSPTGALGNKLPFLMDLPDWLVPAKAWERRRARTERKFFEIMQRAVEAEMVQTTEKPSWTRSFLEKKSLWGFKSVLEGAYAVGMHGIAGALTIAAPMQSFCLAMIHYPQYQHILHEEVDRVCGDRPPCFGDMPNMPVLRAFIRESMRWRPAVPTGIPHELTQDDVYEGYHLPAGSVMHPLEWCISRDPTMFPDPEAYNPMRWLDPAYSTFKEDLTVHPTITQYSQFGYGRRVCQGQEVTEADMFVGVGAMAWLFNISKDDPNSDADSAYESGADESLEQDDQFRMDKKPGISVNTGIETPPDEKSIEQIQTPPPTPSEPRKPEGLTQSLESIRANGNIPEPTITSRSAPSDPTLAFSPLLIAKPYPFKFSMRIRNADRAAFARREYEKLRQEGEFPDEKVYWNGGTAGDEMYGWGKV
ncbi:cytochrome P450 [Viridothelium virens]|uniref:Cytochrome P450 n=1 Tax=Viridothelium virens TaxID=1048519 RepID=A0A6A6H918_VIRVR|nr:cytochrome P450 [Viridothelium virens]